MSRSSSPLRPALAALLAISACTSPALATGPTYFVDDAAAAVAHAQAAGAKALDVTPRAGADGCLVAFLHPGSTAGVLSEFVQGGPHAPSPATPE